MTDLTGGCLCGAVRFAVAAEALRGLVYCHCRRCQHRTGTAFAAGALAAPGSVAITAGHDELRTYAPETGFHKQFCGRCGSQLLTVRPDGDVQAVRFGALDDPPALPVLGHQFVAYAAAWHPLPDDGAPRFEERMPLMATPRSR
jgi:hypothetical protein